MKKMDLHAGFAQDYSVLLNQFDQSIANLSQFIQVEMEKPSLTLIEKLNRLKLHRKKLETILEKYRETGDKTWIVEIKYARKVLREARKEWLKLSGKLGDN